VIKIV